MHHQMFRNVKLIILLIGIMGACSGKSGVDPIVPPTERALAVESGYLEITLSNGNVSIRTIDFTYDMDFEWDYEDDGGLVITNNDPTVYDFSLQHTIIIEGEQEHYSAGIIEEGMETAALGIPLVEGNNDFAIYVREDPSHTLLNGYIYEVADWRGEDIVEAPDGQHEYIGDQVFFSISNDTKASERHRIFREYNLFIIGCFIKQVDTSYVGRIDDGRCPIDVADELNTEEAVLYAHEHGIFKTIYSPNDPAWAPEHYDYHWAMVRIMVNRAWDVYANGVEDGEGNAYVNNVVLCVADTGIYHEHEDFALALDNDRLLFYEIFSQDYSKVGTNGEPDPKDYHGHGTNVAGIAAAMGDNDIGLAGMVWDPYIVSVKCLKDDGSGSVAAVELAIQHIALIAHVRPNYKIIGNFSLGAYLDFPAIRDAGELANSYSNTLLIAGAGNDSAPSDFYPASYPEFISVGATQYSQNNGLDKAADFSNYHSSVDICAPGHDITTTDIPEYAGGGECDYPPSFSNDYCAKFWGTSAATPHVSGLAALLWSKYPNWDKERVTNVIKKSADPMFFGAYPGQGPYADREGLMGTGRINAYCALVTCPCELNDWAEQGGGSYWDVGRAITTLSDDSVVVTGSFEDVATFGNINLTSDGDKDIFLARYNSDGSLIGALRAGGEDEVQAYGITTLPDDSVAVTGSFEGTATIDGSQLISAGDRDIFLARYSAAGQPLGAIRAGGEYDVIAYGITSFPVPVIPPSPEADYVVITGEFTGSATFGYGQNAVTLTSEGASDIFVACYDPYNGTLQWAVSAGGTGVDTGRAILSYDSAYAFVTGDFTGIATFGEGGQNETILISNGNTDIFIACYNIWDGDLIWVKQAGGSGYDYGRGITVLSDGSVVVTGAFSGEADFGEGGNQITMNAFGGTDIFVARFDIDGDLVWAKQAGGSGYGTGFSVTALTDDSVWVTGSFTDEAHFGVGGPRRILSGGNHENVFIAKYDETGFLLCAKCTNGTGSAIGRGVTTLSDDSAVITGNFHSELIFGEHELNETAIYPSGDYDVFVAKFEP